MRNLDLSFLPKCRNIIQIRTPIHMLPSWNSNIHANLKEVSQRLRRWACLFAPDQPHWYQKRWLQRLSLQCLAQDSPARAPPMRRGLVVCIGGGGCWRGGGGAAEEELFRASTPRVRHAPRRPLFRSLGICCKQPPLDDAVRVVVFVSNRLFFACLALCGCQKCLDGRKQRASGSRCSWRQSPARCLARSRVLSVSHVVRHSIAP